MHCLEPACVSVCPVAALQKTVEGPVVYNAQRCIGCRYCMTACPFNVPKYDWRSATPLVHKCTMCADRLADGEQPACAKACLTGAVKFGQRNALLAEAHQRISDRPNRYLDQVFGEHEVGGTAVLYLADVAFASLGFPVGLPSFPLPAKTWAVMSLVPAVAGGAAALMAFAYLLTRRQQAMSHQGIATDKEPLPAVSAHRGLLTPQQSPSGDEQETASEPKPPLATTSEGPSADPSQEVQG
jgi:formate dehydrogenase iron-sulfur subunit